MARVIRYVVVAGEFEGSRDRRQPTVISGCLLRPPMATAHSHAGY
jgi:hypothetical protein